MTDCQSRCTHSCKSVYYLILNSKRNNGKDADADGAHTGFYKKAVICKNLSKLCRQCHCNDKHNRCKYHSKTNDVLLGFSDPIRTACSIIIPQNSLRASGNSSQRHSDHQHKTLHDGIAGQKHIAHFVASIMADQHIHNNDQPLSEAVIKKGDRPSTNTRAISSF